MEERLLRSRRMATIGETAAMVGHDLRNPLQGIMGAAYVLKTREASLSESGKEILHIIEDGIERSDKIINDLLEYSNEIQLQRSTSNPKALLDKSLSVLKIPGNITLVNHTHDQPKVQVDVEKMQRVFQNLMKNAVDAMPNGGTLTITSTESKGNLLVGFMDTGEGMSEEILGKIWSPLFTTKAKGMGYGLAIVKRFTEAHGGTVNVETKPGKGSTFTLRIPTHRTAETSIETQPKETVAT
jgi:signal transduction histidine kinase